MSHILNINTPPDFVDGEIILIDKPLHWSSFDVVNKIRCLLKTVLGIRKIKVGHAGTLDPLASGLLIVCTGKATKIIDTLQNHDKTYEATFRLGATTPSFDRETEVNKTFSIDHITHEQVVQAANAFLGYSMQTPPTYSAIRIAGKRAYEFARKNADVDIAQRQIFIKNIIVKKIFLPDISLVITCSKGTYIRTLANDFGKRLDNGAFLYYLRRISVGDFHVENAMSIADFECYLNNFKSEILI